MMSAMNVYGDMTLSKQNYHSVSSLEKWLMPVLRYLMYKVSREYLVISFSKESESEVAQSCPTLCDPMDSSPPGSSLHGILQARILEWVAIPFSRGSSQPRDRTWVSHIAGRRFIIWATREAHHLAKKVKVKSLSRVRLFATPWTLAYQAPPSMGFSKQEYWSGLLLSYYIYKQKTNRKPLSPVLFSEPTCLWMLSPLALFSQVWVL